MSHDQKPRELRSSNGYSILIDAEDFERLSKYKWWVYRRKNQSHVNSVYRSVHVKGKKKIKSIRISRDVLGYRKGYLIDHINGNPLDNRRTNLRFVTHQQNSFNKTSYRKPKGVHASNGKYKAEIDVCAVRVFLGYYKTKTEAMLAYDFGSLMLHGEHGRTNFKHETLAKLQGEKK